MQVKIESNYTLEEIRELYACLVTSGLLSRHDLDQLEDVFTQYETGYYTLNFFNINELLYPFLERFASYSKEERDVFRFNKDTDSFYRNLTLRLLDHSPLRLLAPTCTIDSTTGKLTIRAGQLLARFNFSTHPDYLEQVAAHLNRLLQQQGADVAYYELLFAEDTVFLLLTEEQYLYLVTNRVLDFSRMEYPEVAAWRKTVREEDLPF